MHAEIVSPKDLHVASKQTPLSEGPSCVLARQKRSATAVSSVTGEGCYINYAPARNVRDS